MLVGVSVILSHDSWLYLGDMASARLLFCKVRTSRGRLRRESTESMWHLSCLVQHLSTRFSKHHCQVVMTVIPRLLLNLFCGTEELFLLLIYFFSVSVWTKVFLRENKELAHINALHMVLYHCLVWPEISALRFLEIQTIWNSIPCKILYPQIENKLATGAWTDRPLEWRSSEPR